MLPGPTFIAPSSVLMFSGTAGHSLADFIPTQQASDHLLERYWIVVHPIAKVLHRPSFEVRYRLFWDEVSKGIEPVGSLQAVVFAVLFSAVVSMSDEDALKSFAIARKTLELQFQQSTEAALTRANYLGTTKLETMQASVIYMIPLCRGEISRAHLTLVGSAVRLGECMGLHRDGTQVFFNPFRRQ